MYIILSNEIQGMGCWMDEMGELYYAGTNSTPITVFKTWHEAKRAIRRTVKSRACMPEYAAMKNENELRIKRIKI